MIKGFDYTKGIVGTYSNIPFYLNKAVIEDGDTIIFSPIVENDFAKEICDIDFLQSIANLLCNMYPKCHVVVSPVKFDIKVTRNV